MQNNSWLFNLFNSIKFNKNQAEKSNDAFNIFNDIGSEEEDTLDLSVVKKFFKEKYQSSNQVGAHGAGFDSSTGDFLYASVSTNKPVRIASYRRMALFPEVGDAIDEICDNSLAIDSNGKIVRLDIASTSKLQEVQISELEDSFEEFVSLYDFETNMFDYMRQFVIDGELAWENIINKDKKDAGILNVNPLPPETFDYVFDTKTKKKVGIAVLTDTSDVNTNDLANQKQIQGGVQIQNLSHASQIQSGEAVFLPFDQITYISTGLTSSDGLITYPVLERARKAYNQLSLIEDSIIIYRLVRAPERLVFNVDVGNLPRQRAEQEVLKMMKRYNTKKVYNQNTGSIANNYDPHLLVESLWFAKGSEGTGTTVTSLPGGANLGELSDLDYFLRKLYLALKIPFTRLKEPKVVVNSSSESVNYEEYRFSKFIVRLQNNFAKGLKEAFKSHLKLKNIWTQYELTDRDFKIKFTPPSNFEVFELQQILKARITNYDLVISNHPEFSKTLAMEKYLMMSDDDIEENWDKLVKESMDSALLEFKVNEMKKSGLLPITISKEAVKNSNGWEDVDTTKIKGSESQEDNSFGNDETMSSNTTTDMTSTETETPSPENPASETEEAPEGENSSTDLEL